MDFKKNKKSKHEVLNHLKWSLKKTHSTSEIKIGPHTKNFCPGHLWTSRYVESCCELITMWFVSPPCWPKFTVLILSWQGSQGQGTTAARKSSDLWIHLLCSPGSSRVRLTAGLMEAHFLIQRWPPFYYNLTWWKNKGLLDPSFGTLSPGTNPRPWAPPPNIPI